MTTIKLTADGVVKEFGLPHAQAMLLLQIKMKCKSCWEIVDGEGYEFNGVELYAIKRNKTKVKGEAESMGDPSGSKPTK
jgi:hypothetical protein